MLESLSKAEAEAARDKLNAAGGTANIYPHGTWPAQSKDAYVVEDGSTLTFYYDAKKAMRTGTVYGIDQKMEGHSAIPAWAGTVQKKNKRITKVVFDSSFKGYKPTTTCFWLSNCTKIKTIEGLSNLCTDQVTKMNDMFYDCSVLTSLDVSNFNTSKVTGLNKMFYDCYALTSLDVSNFDVTSVTDFTSMFSGCKVLTSIYCNDDWQNATVQKSGDMFFVCYKLKGAVVYDASKVDVSMANPTTGYFTKKTGTGINAPTANVPQKQGFYNLQGVKMQGSLEQLPAGIYIVNGRKEVKK